MYASQQSEGADARRLLQLSAEQAHTAPAAKRGNAAQLSASLLWPAPQLPGTACLLAAWLCCQAGWLGSVTHLMVMPRSCSSARVSVRRWSPACSMAMMPAAATRESVRVDLPWSTWAMTDMLRML